MLKKKGVRVKDMEYLEGRLNHDTFIILLYQNFLNSIIKTKDQ